MWAAWNQPPPVERGGRRRRSRRLKQAALGPRCRSCNGQKVAAEHTEAPPPHPPVQFQGVTRDSLLGRPPRTHCPLAIVPGWSLCCWRRQCLALGVGDGDRCQRPSCPGSAACQRLATGLSCLSERRKKHLAVASGRHTKPHSTTPSSPHASFPKGGGVPSVEHLLPGRGSWLSPARIFHFKGLEWVKPFSWQGKEEQSSGASGRPSSGHHRRWGWRTQTAGALSSDHD